MDSPFIFDKSVTGKSFAGRRGDCNSLSGIVTHGQNAVIWGPPKSGKMSVVRQTLFNLRTSGHTPVLCELDLLNIRTPELFLRKFAGNVIKSVVAEPQEMASIAAEFLGGTSLAFDETLYSETGDLFQGSFPLSEEECRDIIELPYRLAAARNTDVIVVVQDFQNIYSDEGEKVFRVMQDVMGAHKDGPAPYCSFVLLGSRVNAMEEIFQRRKFFWNVVERLELSPLTSNEIAEYVMRGFSMGGKVIDRDLVQGVCTLFRNNVWHINHFFFICDCLSKGYISEITFRDALSCMLSVHEPEFHRIMDDLTPFQTRLLRAVIDGVVKFSTTDVIEKYALNSSANVKRLKDALMKKEVICFNDREEPVIMDPLFEYWLRQFYFDKAGVSGAGRWM
ncbi:MAG: hypothetical protein ACI3Y9_08410 [Candidatus Cryptobacteroides sp.]